MTYLAVPIAAKNYDNAKEQIKTAVDAGAEMLELRTDYLDNLNVHLLKEVIAFARQRPVVIIVTCRDKKQGGKIDYSQTLRTEILTEAIRAGTDFIDCEFDNFLDVEVREKIMLALSQTSRTRLILSAHNFDSTFRDIGRIYRDMLSVFPAAIPKLVYTARHINDCFQGIELLTRRHSEAIIFAMGEAGMISRVIAKKLGCLVTFAGLDDKKTTAPGQLTISQLKNLYQYDRIDAETELYGVIGSPVAHSLGPAVHNACFADAKLNKLYLPLLVEGGQDEFDEFMRNVTGGGSLGFKGFSVTIPHKRNALEFVRQNYGTVEPLAAKIGVANTIIIDLDGRVSAYNTDYAGALDAICSTLKIKKSDLKTLSVAVIGAGGVSRAIVAGLTDAKAEVTIYNRTVERGRGLAEEFSCDFSPLAELPGFSADLLINATSIGMYPDVNRTPCRKDCLNKDLIVFDTVYNPAETRLLKNARAAGAKTIDGISMFIAQAAAQFKLFTGKDANTKLMRKIIVDCFSDKDNPAS